MFAIRPPQEQSSSPENAKPTDSCTPNILPCRIHHEGPVESLGRFWNSIKDEKDENLQTAYFRGRRLRGRRVALPEGYQGLVGMPTDRVLPQGKNNGNSELDAQSEQEEPVKILEKQATFDEFIVWGHEKIPAADDPFVKGVEEWLKMAEAIHTQSSDEKKAST